MPKKLQPLLCAKDVAEYLGLTERTVQRRLNTGQLPGRKICGRWRIDPAMIERFRDPARPQKQ